MNASLLIKFEFSRAVVVWAIWTHYRFRGEVCGFFKKQIIQLIRAEAEANGTHATHWNALVQNMLEVCKADPLARHFLEQAAKVFDEKWPNFPNCKLH